VFSWCHRFICAFALLSVWFAPVLAQDNRQLFRKPETALEFWRAVQLEIELGKFDLAAEFLKGFLAKNPTDEELLQIEEKEGISAFLRLLTIPELRADAKALVERVNDVVQKHLGDPKRISALVRSLTSDNREEAAYALGQLRRSGPVAVPGLLKVLLETPNASDEHRAVLGALTRLNRNATPPLLAALDVDNPVVRAELMDVLLRRADASAVPWLWYWAGSPKQPGLVRKQAAEALAALLNVPADKLPSAKEALTREAERYYRHRVRFADPEAVTVWRWDGNELVSQKLPASAAEEYYGLRFARQALDIDPAHAPAQVVFLSLALEKGFERGGLDQPLEKGAPGVKELLRTVNPDLVEAVLEQALADQRLPVVLGTVRALGDVSEVGATRSLGRRAPALVRALSFPDRRVQLAAADALLRIPGPPPALASARVVEILRRAAAADPVPRALVADFDRERAQALAAAVQQAGLEPVVVHTGREATRRLTEAADIDVLLVDAALPDPMLPHLLAQVRADNDNGLLPLLVLAPLDQIDHFQRLTERYRNVWVLPATTSAEVLKQVLPARLAEAGGRPLSEEERKNRIREALLWLARLARGEVPGYDVRPAEGAILKALRSDELAPTAIEAAGRLPGRVPQRELAALVLDASRPAPVRAAAAAELSRHIQQRSLALTNEQVASLTSLFGSADDAQLKANVALVIGSMRPDARQTGERLQQYAPSLPQPAAPSAPSAPEKEKPGGTGS
jgi:CheY-like chemotaxis protein